MLAGLQEEGARKGVLFERGLICCDLSSKPIKGKVSVYFV